MKKLLFAALALSCILLPAEAKKKVRVHTIGDSTMADYAENTTRTRGWGEMFQEFFSDDVEVMNYAPGVVPAHLSTKASGTRSKPISGKATMYSYNLPTMMRKVEARTATTDGVPTRGGTTKPTWKDM